MSLERSTILRYAWRASLIGLLAAGILAFGYSHGRAWLGTRAQLPSAPARVQAPEPFEPLAGSSLVGSYECVYNGEKATFAQYRSTHPARKVVDQFEERYGKPTAQATPNCGTMVHVATQRYAAAGAVDKDGCSLAIVAFEEPKTGGSVYFVGRSRPRDLSGWRHGDVPGEEVPGIPRPPRARRVFCVDGLGGIPSRLLVYEGWGALDDAVEVFAAEMPKAGWQRNSDAEKIIQKHLEGRFLTFVKGTRRAMIYVERDPGTNSVRTAVAYTVKDWLPPDRGL